MVGRSRPRSLQLPLVALMLAFLWPVGARAGGGDFSSDDNDDSRSTVFGFVKDKDGDPVDSAKVTIHMEKLNTDLVLQSDAQGHFTGKLFYKLVDPEDVDLTCSKDGYRQAARTRKPPLAAGAPIEMDCVLDKP